MKTIEVQTVPPYQVHIGPDACSLFPELYGSVLSETDKIAVIADEKAAGLHIGRLLDALGSCEVHVLEIPEGERAKSIETFMAVHTFLLENGFSRKSALIAFGGGQPVMSPASRLPHS